jgi:hypothetical protein
MLLDQDFEPYARRTPFTVMARGALERLLAPERLDQLFNANADADAPYERDVLFAQLVEVVARFVVRVDASLRSSVRLLDDVLTGSDEAVYLMLRGVEPGVYRTLVQNCFEQAQAALQELGVSRKSWIDGYRVKVIDGKALQQSRRRIKDLSTYWDAPLPDRMLVAWDQATGMVSDIVLCDCEPAQERSLLPQVLKTVDRGQLWIGDSRFCALKFLFGLASQGAFFVIHQHDALQPKVLASLGEVDRTANGEPILEELVEIEVDSQPMPVRRLTVKLSQPTRDGDNELHILTNVGDVDATGAQIAELYLKRWTSEAVFHEMAMVLKNKVETDGYLTAALFVFSIAAIIENTLILVKGAIEAVHGPGKFADISGLSLSRELSRTHAGMMVAVEEPLWSVFREMSLAEFAAVVRKLAANVPLTCYKKTKRGPKKPPPEKKAYSESGYVSTDRILRQRKKPTT